MNVSEDGCWILTFRFPFSCLYNSCVSFLFCLKVRRYEKLESLFLKLHEDWNDSYSNVHVLYKAPQLRFSCSVSKTPSTLNRFQTKTILFCSGYGYRPHYNGPKMDRFENALQSGTTWKTVLFENAVFLVWTAKTILSEIVFVSFSYRFRPSTLQRVSVLKTLLNLIFSYNLPLDSFTITFLATN